MKVERDTEHSVDDAAAGLWSAMVKLATAMRSATGNHAGDLTEAQVSILLTLVGRGPLRITELARSERVRTPTMTIALKRLGRLGLIQRLDDSSDLRCVLIGATPLGVERCEHALSVRRAAMHAWLRRLGEEDRVLLQGAVRVLDKLTEQSPMGS
jgi:DNA-binding MarR family transcriptional regulator